MREELQAHILVRSAGLPGKRNRSGYFAGLSENGPDCAMSHYVVCYRPALDTKAKVYTEFGLTKLHALREKEVREEIAGRLRQVCATFPDAEFQQLVGEMAERQLKDERRLIW